MIDKKFFLSIKISIIINDLINRVRENDPTLNRISFVYDNIGDQGSQALAQSLRTNTSLKYLYLGRNNIVDQGVQALVQALQTNSTLKDLKLEYNKIDSNNIFRRILESIKINEFPHKFEQNYAKKIQRQGIYHDLVV